MDCNISANEEEVQVNPLNESLVKTCKETGRSRNEASCKKGTGIPKRCLTLERPLTSKVNPKHSKTRLPMPTTRQAPVNLSRTKRSQSCPPKTMEAKKLPARTTEIVPTIFDKNKLKLFNVAKDKLSEIQSDFMMRCVKLKEITGIQHMGYYKFVGLVLNENCKLTVSDDALMRLPKCLPTSDFKERVKICVESGLNVLYEHLKDIMMSQNEVECREQVECTRALLEQDQDTKLDVLLKQVDIMCKDCKSNVDIDLTNTSREVQEIRRSHKQIEKKMLDFKKQYTEEQLQLDCTHRTAIEESKREREELQKTLMEQINEYKAKYEKQTDTMCDKESKMVKKNTDIKDMKKRNTELNAGMKQLTGRLQNRELELDSSRARVRAKCDSIASLKNELLQVRTHIQNLQTSSAVQSYQFDDKDKVIIELQAKVVACIKARNSALEEDVLRDIYRNLSQEMLKVGNIIVLHNIDSFSLGGIWVNARVNND